MQNAGAAVSPPRLVVFTGAGISGDGPASLPLGFRLRNDLLQEVYEAARSVPGAASLITQAQLDELMESGRKLEVVLGRVWGTIGDDALDCLFALRVALPNETHLLAAVHLARGGSHVTLNLDVGIELAYDLLTGRATLPDDAPIEYHRVLPAWRRLVPDDTAPLRVAASRADLDAWVADGRPPALLKPHGSLSVDQTHLIDVVVVDVEELGQLAPGRRAAIDRVSDADVLLITGYSGVDPDAYRPLLDASPTSTGKTTWRCYSLPEDSPVWRDTADRGIELRVGHGNGDTDGRASTALQELLGVSETPSWPRLEMPGPRYQERFRDWATRFRRRHPPERFAQAWAWLAADLGELDVAVQISGLLAEANDRSAQLRHAEILYTRAQGGDRDRAAALYRRIARDRDVVAATRALCLIRAGDVARGRATRARPGLATVMHLGHAFLEPARVIVLTRNGRHDREMTADAYRAMQQTGLRVLERAAAVSPAPFWRALAMTTRPLTAAGRRAEFLADNGNRRALVRQHRMLLTALAYLLRGQTPPERVDQDLRALHDAYHAADDYPGAANCTATRSVLAAARGDFVGAQELLGAARYEYSWEREDREPLPSGAALLTVLSRVIERQGRRHSYRRP